MNTKKNITQQKKELSIKKTGRPSKYNKTVINEFITLLQEGTPLKEAQRQPGLKWSTFVSYKNADEKLKEAYQTARADGIDYSLQEIDDLIKETLNDKSKQSMMKTKLIDTLTRHRHFLASKLNRESYGTHQDKITLTNNKGEQFSIEWQK